MEVLSLIDILCFHFFLHFFIFFIMAISSGMLDDEDVKQGIFG